MFRLNRVVGKRHRDRTSKQGYSQTIKNIAKTAGRKWRANAQFLFRTIRFNYLKLNRIHNTPSTCYCRPLAVCAALCRISCWSNKRQSFRFRSDRVYRFITSISPLNRTEWNQFSFKTICMWCAGARMQLRLFLMFGEWRTQNVKLK